MSEPLDQRTPAELARGFAGVTAASILGNLFAYALLLSAARVLAAEEYSALVSLINVLLVGSVPAFALQAVIARRVATGNTHDLVRVSAVLAVAIGLIFALLAPIEASFLHLQGVTAPLLVAAAVPGIALQGLCQGVWQGRQAFVPLALTTFAGMLGRAGAALLGLLIGGTATATLTALALGVTVTALVCLAKLPRTPDTEPSAPSSLAAESGSLLSESAVAAHAYGVLLLLSVADLLLASHVLDKQSAAIYAAGSVMTKAALWLPQSAANVLFASMTDHGRHRELFVRAAGAILGLGGLLTFFCWLAAGLVTAVVGGNRYPQLRNEIWLFAGLGSCLALLQFAVVSGLAIRSARAAWIAWLTIVAEVSGVYLLGDSASVRSIIMTVTAVNVVAAAVALALRAGQRAPGRPPAQLGSSPGQGPGAKTAS